MFNKVDTINRNCASSALAPRLKNKATLYTHIFISDDIFDLIMYTVFGLESLVKNRDRNAIHITITLKLALALP
jgi:hypothetical protein